MTPAGARHKANDFPTSERSSSVARPHRAIHTEPPRQALHRLAQPRNLLQHTPTKPTRNAQSNDLRAGPPCHIHVQHHSPAAHPATAARPSASCHRAHVQLRSGPSLASSQSHLPTAPWLVPRDATLAKIPALTAPPASLLSARNPAAQSCPDGVCTPIRRANHACAVPQVDSTQARPVIRFLSSCKPPADRFDAYLPRNRSSNYQPVVRTWRCSQLPRSANHDSLGRIPTRVTAATGPVDSTQPHGDTIALSRVSRPNYRIAPDRRTRTLFKNVL